MPYDPRQMGNALQNMPTNNSRLGNSRVQAVMPNEQQQPPMNSAFGYQSPNQPNPAPVPLNMQPGLQGNMGLGGMTPRPFTNPRGY